MGDITREGAAVFAVSNDTPEDSSPSSSAATLASSPSRTLRCASNAVYKRLRNRRRTRAELGTAGRRPPLVRMGSPASPRSYRQCRHVDLGLPRAGSRLRSRSEISAFLRRWAVKCCLRKFRSKQEVVLLFYVVAT